MKRIIAWFAAIALSALLGLTSYAEHKIEMKPDAGQNGSHEQMHMHANQQSACKYCGMDRVKFNYSAMTVIYDDDSSADVCSLHCAALDIAVGIDKTPKRILAADYDTHEMIDAEQANWVIGGAKPGVMSARAKWAFKTKEAADAYVKANGGTLGTFEDAMKAAFEDMYKDTKMIREKRKAMKSGSHGGMHH